MTAYRTELGQVTYNPQTRAYQALVSFHEAGETTRVPCALPLPLDTEPGVVASALIRQAREIRRDARVPLISRIRAAAAPDRIDALAHRVAARRPGPAPLGA